MTVKRMCQFRFGEAGIGNRRSVVTDGHARDCMHTLPDFI